MFEMLRRLRKKISKLIDDAVAEYFHWENKTGDYADEDEEDESEC